MDEEDSQSIRPSEPPSHGIPPGGTPSPTPAPPSPMPEEPPEDAIVVEIRETKPENQR
jgi:hypothetical protein